MSRESLLAQTLVELTDTLVDECDIVELLFRLADRCVDVLGVGAAGIMLAGPDGNLRSTASSSEPMRLLALFELQTQEGPSIDCYRTGRPELNQSLESTHGRWPLFTLEALAAGFRSVQAMPLRHRGSVIGVLSLLHTDSYGLIRTDVRIAQAMADVATIAILQHRSARESETLNEQLTQALNSRVAIEQAKGVLAERLGLSVGQAFSAMRQYARSRNLRLVDVANSIVDGTMDTAELDDRAGPGSV